MKISSLNKENVITSLKFFLVIPVALVVRNLKKDIWLISERSTQARDNGYCFFKYLREQYPNHRVYYIIDKKASDYSKLKQYGNVIQYDSWKHYFYFCLSQIHISSHVGGNAPSNAPIHKRLKPFLKYKDIFIPHGVSYGIAEFCIQKYAKIDLYVCSGKAEYENVLENYGYQKKEVSYTGFPRLDQWHKIEIKAKQILLMPTWRRYIRLNPETVFEGTDYYLKYQELLSDYELKKFLQENDLRLVFYLHNDMQLYAGQFKCDCNNIEIVYQDDKHDIQELLKESALMITDYSSVHFDFAYMKKPVIYYQFDKEEFFEKQYSQGEFNIENEGFGPVVYEREQLIDEIKNAWNNKFQMKEKYYNRMRQFYQIYDNKNCERVFRAINNMVKNINE